MEPGSEPGPSAKQAPPQAHLAAGPMAQLTVGRVKSMIKEDAEVKSISTEACFVVAKATEVLLEAMATRAAGSMLNEGRSTLLYSDTASAVAEWRSLDFLDEIVPPKVTAATLLARMEAPGTQHGTEQEIQPAADA